MLSMTFDFRGAYDFMSNLERHEFPQAVKSTLNKLAFNVSKKYLPGEMDKYIDKGANPFTKKGIFFEGATKRRFKAVVFYPGNRHYLSLITFGGVSKPLKNNKVLVQPILANQRVNKYGNLPRNTVKKKASNEKLYFVGKKGKSGKHGLYRRYKKQAPKLIIMLDTPQRRQERIFPADKLGVKYVKRHFNNIFQMQMKKAIKTTRFRQPTGF